MIIEIKTYYEKSSLYTIAPILRAASLSQKKPTEFLVKKKLETKRMVAAVVAAFAQLRHQTGITHTITPTLHSVHYTEATACHAQRYQSPPSAARSIVNRCSRSASVDIDTSLNTDRYSPVSLSSSKKNTIQGKTNHHAKLP